MEALQPYIEAAASVAPVTVPFLGVVLAVFLALRRFQREQIWLKRMEAYTQILQSLHTCKQDYERDSANDIARHTGDQESPALTPEQKGRVRAAFDHLRLIAATGRLIISDRAIAALDAFFHNSGDVEGFIYFEYCDHMASVCEKTIAEVTAAGRAELNLRRWSWAGMKDTLVRIDLALDWMESAPAIRRARGKPGDTGPQI